MAIQPIDLQNMYSQLSNVQKATTGQQQAAQLSEALQGQSQLEKNMQNSQKVQQASDDKAKSNQLNPDGHQGSGNSGSSFNKKNEENAEENINIAANKYKYNSHLGTIIDITR